MATRRLLNPQLGGVFIPEDDLVTVIDPTEWEEEEVLEEEDEDFDPDSVDNDYPNWEEPDIDEAQEWEPIEGPQDYYPDPDDDFGDVSHFADEGDF